jgi:hypothetical protein
MKALTKAIAIAVTAHAGQVDKAGAPYVTHPLRLMAKMNTDIERIVAVLHDVVEDCDGWTFARLRAEGIPEEAIQALRLVTKRPRDKNDYAGFVRRAASNPVSRRVKIADIEDNMDIRRLEQIGDKDVQRLRKYLKAWRQLNSIS